MHIISNSEDGLLIPKELEGEKQAKYPIFFLKLFFGPYRAAVFGECWRSRRMQAAHGSKLSELPSCACVSVCFGVALMV
jgi:hypothetical protein